MHRTARSARSRQRSPEFSGIWESGLGEAQNLTSLFWLQMRPEFGPAQVAGDVIVGIGHRRDIARGIESRGGAVIERVNGRRLAVILVELVSRNVLVGAGGTGDVAGGIVSDRAGVAHPIDQGGRAVVLVVLVLSNCPLPRSDRILRRMLPNCHP